MVALFSHIFGDDSFNLNAYEIYQWIY